MTDGGVSRSPRDVRFTVSGSSDIAPLDALPFVLGERAAAVIAGMTDEIFVSMFGHFAFYRDTGVATR